MNSNFISNAMLIISAVITNLAFYAPQILGCTALPGDKFDCSASWLPPSWALGVAGALTVVAVVARVVQGIGGGGVTKALTSPVAVITSSGEPGTVTKQQVESGIKR